MKSSAPSLRPTAAFINAQNLLVAVGSAPIITSDRRKVLARQILPIGEHRLLELVTSAICFEKWDSRAGDFVPANPPMMLVRTLEDRRGRFRFPPLSGLVNAPTMRADGSLLTVPGYDAATGLLFDPGDDAFPPIPARPSRSDAVEALRLIKGLLDGFPFIGAPDRSVALAAILTATVRRSLPTAPMFGFTAPTPGSGKTKLADIASIIATGREAGVISQGRTDEETEKRIGALLLGGAAIAIDNVEQPVGGDLLCQLLTQQTVRLRVLGKSDVPEMPTNVSVTVTGNNLTILGDLARRTLICRLDPGVERPELREFDFDPVAQAKADRGVYLVGALTALRAFIISGRPNRPSPLGSFETWSDLVRAALLWLGEADPVETLEQGRASDPGLDHLRALLTHWRDAIGERPITAHELIALASERRAAHFDGKGEFKLPSLREALLDVAAEGGFISNRRLGNWLAKRKGRIVEALRLELATERGGSRRWCVLPA